MDDDVTQMGDWSLALLYRILTKEGGEFGVTLLVGGAWLTGMAVGGRAWWNQVAEVVRQAPRGGGMDGALRTFGQIAYPAELEVEAGVVEPVDEDRPIGFIHLRDASLIAPGIAGGTPNPGGLVRLRIEEVQGWLLGNLGPEDYVPPTPIA